MNDIIVALFNRVASDTSLNVIAFQLIHLIGFAEFGYQYPTKTTTAAALTSGGNYAFLRTQIDTDNQNVVFHIINTDLSINKGYYYRAAIRSNGTVSIHDGSSDKPGSRQCIINFIKMR